MPRYLINIPIDEELRIRRLLKERRYQTFDHFVEVAIRNQLIAEEEGGSPWSERASRTRLSQKQHGIAKGRQSRSLRVAPSFEPDLTIASSVQGAQPKTVPEPRDDELAGALFWAQYYKFLPLKMSGRVLDFMTREDLVPMQEFAETALAVAVKYHEVLEMADNALGRGPGERLSTSFPRRNEKSRARFRDQFLPSRRARDGLLDGFLARAKFANILKVQGAERVGLTERGFEFVRLHNPVLDEPAPTKSALSEAEVEFLVAHIRERIPLENRQMVALLAAIDDGVGTRPGLDQAMKQFYHHVLPRAGEMTQAHVSAMRAGVQSRLQEMALIETHREGKAVAYKITAHGRKVLEQAPSTSFVSA